MNRRLFLTRALAAVPILVAGEELAELLAPRRTIMLPPRGGWFHARSAGQVWAMPAEGGYMYSAEVSERLRQELTPIMRFLPSSFAYLDRNVVHRKA